MKSKTAIKAYRNILKKRLGAYRDCGCDRCTEDRKDAIRRIQTLNWVLGV